jgi:uncharacterized protein
VTEQSSETGDVNDAWPIRIGDSPLHGRGVFALRDIVVDEVIEIAPIVVLPAEDWSSVEQTTLGGYVYDVGDGRTAVAGGSASFYNHDCPANAVYEADADAGLVTVWAATDIAAGDEVCINYNGDPKSDDQVEFGD